MCVAGRDTILFLGRERYAIPTTFGTHESPLNRHIVLVVFPNTHICVLNLLLW